MTTEELAREVARYIAPFVADELARRGPAEGAPVFAGEYDEATCRLFVSDLGKPIIQRGVLFFGALARQGALSSPEVKDLLGLEDQRSIGRSFTVSLSKRIKTLDLNPPWTIDGTPDGQRTVWRDREGIAARMHAACLAEAQRRGLAV